MFSTFHVLPFLAAVFVGQPGVQAQLTYDESRQDATMSGTIKVIGTAAPVLRDRLERWAVLEFGKDSAVVVDRRVGTNELPLTGVLKLSDMEIGRSYLAIDRRVKLLLEFNVVDDSVQYVFSNVIYSHKRRGTLRTVEIGEHCRKTEARNQSRRKRGRAAIPKDGVLVEIEFALKDLVTRCKAALSVSN